MQEGADMAITGETPALPPLPQRRALSPEQRMNEFHTERLTRPAQHPFDRRRDDAEQTGTVDETALNVARAAAVEYVVKAFAAVDRNLALADRARAQQEKSQAAIDSLRLELERELASARQAREEADRELTKARVRTEELLSEARAKSDELLKAARAQCKKDVESARRQLIDALIPLRDVVGQTTATIDEFVGSSTFEPGPPADTIDIRSDAGDNIGDGAGTARLIRLVPSPVTVD